MVLIMQGSKPWRYTGKEQNMDREDIKMLVEKWWDIYDDDTLNYQTTTPLNLDNIKAALSEPDVAFIPAPSAA